MIREIRVKHPTNRSGKADQEGTSLPTHASDRILTHCLNHIFTPLTCDSGDSPPTRRSRQPDYQGAVGKTRCHVSRSKSLRKVEKARSRGPIHFLWKGRAFREPQFSAAGRPSSNHRLLLHRRLHAVGYQRILELTWEAIVKGILAILFPILVTWVSLHWRSIPNVPAHQAEYWLAIGGIFFTSLVVAISAPRLFVFGYRQLQRWRHPPTLRITPHGGRSAAVEIHYSGVPTTWEARIRILEVVGNTFNPHPPNPNPLLRQSYFEKDGQSHRAMNFVDGDTASIVLAEMKYSHYLSSHRETWVAVPNADDERDTRVSGDTTIELNLNTKPIQKKLSIKRCFRVSRPASDTMECLEVPCS